jgi:predicted ATP-grasp superfamily ATP-dependent carboligase
MDRAEFVDFLLHLCKQHHLDGWVLFPLQDEVVELVARNTERLGSVYRLVTQAWEVIRWAGDKQLTHQMAHDTAVPCPRTAYPASERDLADLDLVYPVIIKPAISIRLQYAIRLKALPAADLDTLVQQYRLAISVMPPQEIMVQEVIPGGGLEQFSVAAYCKDGRIITSMTARRTRQYPIDYGLGSSFVEAVEVPGLTELAERLLAYMRVTGMVEVEFKHDTRDDQYKLLDINVRPWGWHSLCRACGLDFPYMQYCDILGQEEPRPIQARYGARWIRALTDLPAGLQEIRAGRSTPAKYLRSLPGRTVFSVLDWTDPLPAGGDLAVAFSRGIGRKLGRKEH